MIEYAKRTAVEKQVSHLSFEVVSLADMNSSYFDVATSTLCLHEMMPDEACETLRLMATLAGRLLIADYSKPRYLSSKMAIEFDEFISGHYLRFRRYRALGGIKQYARRCELEVVNVVSSEIDGIDIWELKRNDM